MCPEGNSFNLLRSYLTWFQSWGIGLEFSIVIAGVPMCPFRWCWPDPLFLNRSCLLFFFVFCCFILLGCSWPHLRRIPIGVDGFWQNLTWSGRIHLDPWKLWPSFYVCDVDTTVIPLLLRQHHHLCRSWLSWELLAFSSSVVDWRCPVFKSLAQRLPLFSSKSFHPIFLMPAGKAAEGEARDCGGEHEEEGVAMDVILLMVPAWDAVEVNDETDECVWKVPWHLGSERVNLTPMTHQTSSSWAATVEPDNNNRSLYMRHNLSSPLLLPRAMTLLSLHPQLASLGSYLAHYLNRTNAAIAALLSCRLSCAAAHLGHCRWFCYSSPHIYRGNNGRNREI